MMYIGDGYFLCRENEDGSRVLWDAANIECVFEVDDEIVARLDKDECFKHASISPRSDKSSKG